MERSEVADYSAAVKCYAVKCSAVLQCTSVPQQRSCLSNSCASNTAHSLLLIMRCHPQRANDTTKIATQVLHAGKAGWQARIDCCRCPPLFVRCHRRSDHAPRVSRQLPTALAEVVSRSHDGVGTHARSIGRHRGGVHGGPGVRRCEPGCCSHRHFTFTLCEHDGLATKSNVSDRVKRGNEQANSLAQPLRNRRNGA